MALGLAKSSTPRKPGSGPCAATRYFARLQELEFIAQMDGVMGVWGVQACLKASDS